MVFDVDLNWAKLYYNMSYFVLLSDFSLFGKQQNNLDKLIKNNYCS